MKINRLSAAFVAVLISACGGGGGGDSSPSVPTVPVVVTPTTPVVITAPMVCTSNAIWSNPAVYSAVFQDCVAPIGVQVLVTPSLNTMKDTSCVPTVGAALSTACKAYMANGTVLLADTSIIVNNHFMVWMAYVSVDGKSNLVLLDSVTMTPVGSMVLPGSFLWLIGNPTGVATSENVNGLPRTKQVRWDGAALVATCYSNC